MAVKTKDQVIDITNLTEDKSFTSDKKYNSLYFTGKTYSEAISNIAVSGDNLVITTKSSGNHTITLVDYYKQNGKNSYKYIKTTDDLINIIDNGLVTNPNKIDSDDFVVNAKKKTVTINGTVFNDTIDATTSLYEGYKFTINGNEGNDTITGSKEIDIIKGGAGNDSIIAGKGDDTITGGVGENIIKYNSGDGSDTVILTKGEDLTIDMSAFKKSELNFEVVGKDLVISENALVSDKYLTIKDFGTKDVTTDSGSVELLLKAESGTGTTTIDLREDLYLDKIKPVKNYTGTWHAEDIDASDYTVRDKKGDIVTDYSKKGLTIKGNGGDDSVTGSNYSDTITTTTGNDTIISGKGNDKITTNAGNDTITGGEGNDTITGGVGENVINFGSGDGHDTVILTKGEELTIDMSAFKKSELSFEVVGKDLVISKDTYNSVKIKDFGTKDVTTDSGSVELLLKAESGTGTTTIDLREDLYLDKIELTKNYTGTWHDENVDASEYTVRDKKGNIVIDYSKKGLTIKGNGGEDSITGSNYSDVITTSNNNDTIISGKGNDKITTNGGDDSIFGGEGKDTINAGSGNDTIYGDDGNDVINAGDGHDSIIAGVGDDIITGGVGTNIIKYNSGDGHDTVVLTKGENLNIDMSSAFASTNLSFVADGKNLLIYNKADSTAKYLTIKDFMAKDVTNNATKKDENTSSVTLTLSDKTIDLRNDLYLDEIAVDKNYTGSWHAENINASGYTVRDKKGDIVTDYSKKGLSINGAGGGDSITGSNYSDTIKGGDGNDTIISGTGNDNLYGENGENKFVFNAGDGDDTIYSGKGTDTLQIEADFNDLIFTKNTGTKGYDLAIQYNPHLVEEETVYDKVTVKDYYKLDKQGNNTSSVKYITTKNGSNYVTCSLEEALDYREKYPNKNILVGSGTLIPTSQTEVIIGSDSADSITVTHNVTEVAAGKGNDTINSYSNEVDNVSIDGGEGDDEISIYSLKSANTVFGGEGKDTITGSFYADDTIYGDDGILVDPTQSLGDNDLLQGMKGSDVIYGGGGDDTIHGYLSNDTTSHDTTENTTDELHGGAGNDMLYAESKNNILYGDAGDDIFKMQYGNSEVHGGVGENLYIARYIENDSIEDADASVHTICTDTNTENKDKLYFSKNDSLDDLELHKNGNDLRILYTDNKEVVVKDYFVNNTSCISQVYVNGAYGSDGKISDISKISTIENLIKNGTLVWDTMPSDGNLTNNKDEITVKSAMIINALGENDKILVANNLNVTIDAGDGNDTIYGSYNTSSGSTYIGGTGEDEIYCNIGNDLIFGGDSLTAEERENPEQYLTDTSNNYIEGGAGDDTIYGGSGADTIYTQLKEGSIDTLYYTDEVYSGGGNDEIHGQSYKSIITAGAGNDTIYGTADTEEYMNYKKGDGTDTIDTGTGDKDTIKITGYSKDELTVSQDGNDIVITGEDDDEIILKNAVTTDVNPKIVIGEITYGILDSNFYQNVVTDKTNFAGTKFADNVTGTSGADTLSGGAADDILKGGTGNDSLSGGTGYNTYEFTTGDGTDTIVSTTANTDTIKFTDVTIGSLEASNFTKNGDNLEITYGTGSDKLVLENYFINLPTINLFGQGSDTPTPLKDKLTAVGIIYAEAGDTTVEGVADQNNIIIGSSGNNTVIGHSGNDNMNGGLGDDIYVFNNGDGSDIVVDTNATNVDKLKFNNVTFNSLVFEESSNDLVIKYNPHLVEEATVYDQVTVKNYFTDSNTVKKIIDSTEAEFDIANDNVNTITMTTTTENGTRLNDSITGTTGNDTISGSKGKDTINGGVGNDTVKFVTGDGVDTILLTNEGESDVNVIEFTDVESGNFTKVDDDLVIKYSTDDKVILDDYFTSANASKYNTVKFGETTSSVTELFHYTVDVYGADEGQNVVGLMNYKNDLVDSAYSDTITGGNLADNVTSYAGDDTINTYDGNDRIICPYSYSSGIKYIDAGAGNDYIQGGAQENETVPGSTYIAGLGNDTIDAYKGNDTIYGDLTLTDDPDQDQGGADKIYLVNGNNTAYAGGGNDTIYGGSGSDTIHTGKDAVTISVSKNDGDNSIYFDDDTVVNTIEYENISGITANFNGGTGCISNSIYVSSGSGDCDMVLRTTKDSDSAYQYIYDYNANKGVIIEGNDESKVKLYFHPTDDTITTGDEADIIATGYGEDYDSISTGGGSDNIFLSSTTSETELTVELGAGNDTFNSNYATIKTISINGGDGDDSIYAYSLKGDSTIIGGLGKDSIEASYYNATTIYGDYDTITDAAQTQGENDNITGDSANDIIYGGGGDDTIKGGTGTNVLHGGSGNDSICSYINNGFSTNVSSVVGSLTTMYGDSGNDKIYCQSETNIAYDSEGDEKYFVRSLTQTSSVTDSSGNDEMIICYETTTEEVSQGYHIVLNVNKSGVVADNSLWVLNDTNYDNWKDRTITTGVNIKGGYNSIERISVSTNDAGYYGDGSANQKWYYNQYMKQYVTTTQIDSIKSNIASWLSTYNEGSFNSVDDVLSSGESSDIAALVTQFNSANEAAWQTARVE